MESRVGRNWSANSRTEKISWKQLTVEKNEWLCQWLMQSKVGLGWLTAKILPRKSTLTKSEKNILFTKYVGLQNCPRRHYLVAKAVACRVRGPLFNPSSSQMFLYVRLWGGREKLRTCRPYIVRCRSIHIEKNDLSLAAWVKTGWNKPESSLRSKNVLAQKWEN